MSTRMKIAIALLLAVVVFIILVAPSVDLPATVLDALAYVFLLLFMLRVYLAAGTHAAGRPAPLPCSTGPPLSISGSSRHPLFSLRC